VSAYLIAGATNFFQFCLAKVWSRDDAVGIVAGYGLTNPGTVDLSREKHRTLSISKSYIPTL